MGGRPAKSVKVKTGAIASNDAAVRTPVEDKLRLSWTAWLPERS